VEKEMINIAINENIKLEYDPVADALYIRIREEASAETIEVTDCIYVDVDAKGALLGIEVLAPEHLTVAARKRAFNLLAKKYHVDEILCLRPEKVPEVCDPA